MNDLGLTTLLKGCEHVYSDVELKHKLERAARERRPLRVKLGMDPTAPDIHLGHAIPLGKMRQFQDLGHQGVLIIGDFTAAIGDPSGRSRTRPVLSMDEIKANAETYLAQAGRVVDMSPERLEVRWNSEWLATMRFDDVIRLAGRMTVGQLMKREDFRQRFESEEAISLHELLYPLVQGWDSVNIRADVELGGTDQMYNNLVGRDLQASVGQEPQVVMLMPLLRGLDGTRKMSKSYGNHIPVTDSPLDIFGKTMSIPDALLDEWYSLVTDVPQAEYRPLIAADPMEAKKRLGCLVGAKFHSRDEMAAARAQWEAAFGAREFSTVDIRIPASELKDGAMPAWRLVWLAHEAVRTTAPPLSNSDARRLVREGAFEYDGTRVTDEKTALVLRTDVTFKAGRYRDGERIRQPLLCRAVVG